MSTQAHYLEVIHAAYPDFELETTQLNQQGQFQEACL